MNIYNPEQDELVRVAESNVGKGVFARFSFPAMVVIGEISGEIFEDEGYTSDYCFDLEDGRRLEPFAPFRFLNHCCEPNCDFDWFVDGEGKPASRTLMVVTRREILSGEELTIDYNWPAEDAMPCQCNSPNCRGWIVGIDELEELNLLLEEDE